MLRLVFVVFLLLISAIYFVNKDYCERLFNNTTQTENDIAYRTRLCN